MKGSASAASRRMAASAVATTVAQRAGSAALRSHGAQSCTYLFASAEMAMTWNSAARSLTASMSARYAASPSPTAATKAASRASRAARGAAGGVRPP